MRVMVTGASAPLGAAIVERLLAEPGVDRVLAVSREAVPPRVHPRLFQHAADLAHPREVHDLIHGAATLHGIDTVIHAAQHRDPHDAGGGAHTQTVESARWLVLACAAHATIRRFVHRSFADVYAQRDTTPTLIDEDAPLELDPAAPQWLRDRVEADLTVRAHHTDRLQIAVLRLAELLARDTGSQLWDYLSSRICLRPAGFDPIINVLALDDAAAAFATAARSSATGAFNIPGRDTLPLSCAIAQSGRSCVAVPSSVIAPLYKLRRAVTGLAFRYDLNVARFHFGGMVDGGRAARELGYQPRARVVWPRPWWRVLLQRLAETRC